MNENTKKNISVKKIIEIDTNSKYFVVLPHHVPQEAVARLYEEFSKFMDDPDRVIFLVSDVEIHKID